ncbi:MAG: hypothetical protein Q6M04_11665, partial [Thermostichus sp. BF3_bins_97]
EPCWGSPDTATPSGSTLTLGVTAMSAGLTVKLPLQPLRGFSTAGIVLPVLAPRGAEHHPAFAGPGGPSF